MTRAEIYVVIVAGGKGIRFGDETPKQFHRVAGKPLLMHTFEAFELLLGKAEFILVLPEMEIGRWKHLCVDYDFQWPHRIVEGGPTRFHSVKNALHFVQDRSLVFIHDAVRPLVSEETISGALKVARIHGTAVPVVPLTDSLRQVENGISRAVSREQFRQVQTPQVFRSELLKKAYGQTYRESFTDDAAVIESTGQMVHLVDGNPDNIKVTRPGDLGYVEAVLFQRNQSDN